MASSTAAEAQFPPAPAANEERDSPRAFLLQLLPLVESGASLKAACAKSGLPGARQRLARLLGRIPKARRQHLTAKGKLRALLALPDARLCPARPERQPRRTVAQKRRLMNLAPAARQTVLNTYTALRQQGISGRAAARQAGASVPTLWRWQRRFARQGLAGLARPHRTGRKPAFTVSAAVLASVRRLNVELGGNARAWRAYLASPQCPAELRTALAGRAVPERLLAATRLTRSKVNCHVGEGLLALGPIPGAKEKFHFLNTQP